MKRMPFFKFRAAALLGLSVCLLSGVSRAEDYAMQFDGAKDWVDTALPGSQIATDELTVEFWFRGTNIQSAVRLQATTTGDRIVCGSGATTAPVHRIRLAGIDYDVPIDAKVNDGHWHHIALTYKKNTTGGIIGYVDGVANATTKNAPNAAIPVIAADVMFGSFNGVSEFTAGRIDEVRIWKIARTAAQVFDTYTSKGPLRGNETGLAGYFIFNEDDGTQVLNMAGGAPAVIQGADNVTRYGRIRQDLSFTPLQRGIQFTSTFVPAPQRVAWWKFDEAAGVTAMPADSQGNYNSIFKNSGVLYGQPGVRGDTGNALKFDAAGGASSGVQFPVLPSLFRSGFTFALWVKLGATGGTFAAPVSYNGAGGFNFGILNNNLRLGMGPAGNGSTLTSPQPALNQWTHLAATYDPLTGEFAMWVNATKVASGAAVHIPQNGGLLQMSGLTGLVDDMVVLDSAASAANMQLIMSQGPLALQSSNVASQFIDTGSDSGNEGDRYDFRRRMTAEAWISFDSLPAYEAGLISRGENTWSFNLNSAGKLVYRTPALNVPVITGKTTLTPGRWHHVAAVFDSLTRRTAIYLNGEEDASATVAAGSLFPVDAANRVFIGAIPIGFETGKNFYLGRIDEVRLWSVPRSQDALSSASVRQLHGGDLGLAGAWSFDNLASANSLTDSRLPAPGVPAVFKGGSLATALIGGKVLQPPPATVNNAVWFDGQPFYPYASVPDADEFDFLGSRTVEAWVLPAKNTTPSIRTILSKGTNWRLVLSTSNTLQLLINNGAVTVGTAAPLAEERWQHVAARLSATGQGTGTLRFDVSLFVNGQPVAIEGTSAATVRSVEFPTPAVDTRPLLIGVHSAVTQQFSDPFIGGIDEVRVWSNARALPDLGFLAQRELSGSFSGLAGYWNFNAPSLTTLADGSSAGRNAVLTNVVITDWSEGGNFGTISLPTGVSFVPNANASITGLWRGTVVLDKVAEAGASLTGVPLAPTASGGKFTFTILLHADASGAVRLLKDVIIMKTGTDDAQRLVLVTDPLKIGNFTGVQYRDGKLAGARYSAAAYDFDTREAEFFGGLGGGFGCFGAIRLPDTAATNPYRHKYHPDHAKGFTISRDIMISFPSAANYTAESLTGTYSETVSGVHRSPISTTGTITLRRVSTVATLNQ